ncbi:hypothetical protein L593_08610 [Salinarchaeum sp. Harcht-Bsk1]|uniref:hypothetical protein n=1 Tax=Salinarchaeum sp. Harcht-Bsk1 TaxID=1333523 RepID=UPI0003422E31|nr:hypothetical protein [Salinarchaeum sp. Harcht-Bsk1]AGN01667.1 hypothetical protein L593_08610 [Salinarchaeum sp. Harcht-Bsk1]
MQPGLSEVARDVEADPAAVFEAHDAESVEELVTGAGAPERDATSDRAVRRLFEGDLDRPERRSTTEEPSGGVPSTGDPSSRASACGVEDGSAGESTTTPAVLVELERAIDEAEEPAAVDGDDFDALDDEVADALAVAEELDEADAGEADLESSVPEEWQDD